MSVPLSKVVLRRSPLVFALSLLALASVPAAGAAKPPPPPVQQLDTATAVGSTGVGIDGVTVNIDVHSGPSGEDPGGFVSIAGYTEIRGVVFPVELGGWLTCLNVTGHTAVITMDATLMIGGVGSFGIGNVGITLQDNGGSGSDRFGFAIGPVYDCSTPVGTQPLDGRAQVFDAHPLPTTKADCLGGGFTQWGFKNQGQCIRFVTDGSATGGQG